MEVKTRVGGPQSPPCSRISDMLSKASVYSEEAGGLYQLDETDQKKSKSVGPISGEDSYW